MDLAGLATAEARAMAGKATGRLLLAASLFCYALGTLAIAPSIGWPNVWGNFLAMPLTRQALVVIGLMAAWYAVIRGAQTTVRGFGMIRAARRARSRWER
jgi:hypothetical protein